MATSARKHFLRSALTFAKCFLIAILAISVSMSGLTCYDCLVGDGEIPEFYPINDEALRIASKSLRIDEIPTNHSAHNRWLELQKTLIILDDINPVVASWVRDHHASGTLKFIRSDGLSIDSIDIKTTTERSALAKYDYISHKLYISTPFFLEKHGRQAALLCHEYRHSRQNFGKYFRYIFSHAFIIGGKPDIIENDASLYEKEAETAIYGEQGSPNEAYYTNSAEKNPRP